MAATAVEEKPETKTRSPRKSTAAAKKSAGNGKKRGPKNMTDDHKAKLAAGRAESKTVRDYLAALDEHRPRRGRQVTQESMQAKLDTIEKEMLTAKPLPRLKLIQEKLDIQKALDEKEDEFDLAPLEAEFVKVAKVFAERTKISRKAFIQMGVPSEVLKKADL